MSKGLLRQLEHYAEFREPKHYILKSKTSLNDAWTEEKFGTLEELGQEMLYKTCNGWYCYIEPQGE